MNYPALVRRLTLLGVRMAQGEFRNAPLNLMQHLDEAVKALLRWHRDRKLIVGD